MLKKQHTSSERSSRSINLLLLGLIAGFFLLATVVSTLIFDNKYGNLMSNIHVGSAHLTPNGKIGEAILPFTSAFYFVICFVQFKKSSRLISDFLAENSGSTLIAQVLAIHLPILPNIFLWTQGTPVAPFGNTNFLWAILSSITLSLIYVHFSLFLRVKIEKYVIFLSILVVPVSWVYIFALSPRPAGTNTHFVQMLFFSANELWLLLLLFVVSFSKHNKTKSMSVALFIVSVAYEVFSKFNIFLHASFLGLSFLALLLIIVALVAISRQTEKFQSLCLGSIGLIFYYLANFDFSSIWTKMSDDFGAGEQYVPLYELTKFHLWPIRDFVVPHGYLEDLLPNWISSVSLHSSIAGIGFGLTIISAVLAIGYFYFVGRLIGVLPAFALALVWPGPGFRYMTELFSLVFFLILISLFSKAWARRHSAHGFSIGLFGFIISLISAIGLLLAPGQAGVSIGSAIIFAISYLVLNRGENGRPRLNSMREVFKFGYRLLFGVVIFISILSISPFFNFVNSAISFAYHQANSNMVVNGIPIAFSFYTSSSTTSILGMLLLFAIPLSLFLILDSWKNFDQVIFAFSLSFFGWFVISNTRYWGRVDAQLLSRPGLGLAILLFGFAPIVLSLRARPNRVLQIERAPSLNLATGVLVALVIVIFSQYMPNPYMPNSLPNGLKIKDLQLDKHALDFKKIRFTQSQIKRSQDLNLYLDSLDQSRGDFINLTNNTLLDIDIPRKVVPQLTSLYAIAVNPASEIKSIQQTLSKLPLAGLGDVGNNIQNDGLSVSLRNPYFWNAVMPFYDPIECGTYIMLRSKTNYFPIDSTLCRQPNSPNKYLSDLERVNGSFTDLHSIPGQIASVFDSIPGKVIGNFENSKFSLGLVSNRNELDALAIKSNCPVGTIFKVNLKSLNDSKIQESAFWTSIKSNEILPIYAFPIRLMTRNLEVTLTSSQVCKFNISKISLSIPISAIK